MYLPRLLRDKQPYHYPCSLPTHRRHVGEIVHRYHVWVILTVFSEWFGVFNSPDGTVIFADNAAGFVADVFANRLSLFGKRCHYIRLVAVMVGRLAYILS